MPASVTLAALSVAGDVSSSVPRLLFEEHHLAFGRSQTVSDSAVVIPFFPGEQVDTMLKRLKKQLDKAGILAAAHRHESFVPRAERRALKSRAARKRHRN